MTEKELPVNMNRDFKGIWIPREIWFNQSISALEKILWAEIHSLYDRKKKGCFASNQYLYTFLGIKERQLQNMLANLKSLNLIILVDFDGRQRILKAIYPSEEEEISDEELIAPLGCNELQGRGAENCTSAIRNIAPLTNIYNKEDRKDYTSPLNPSSEIAVAIAPIGAEEALKNLPKSKKAKKVTEFSKQVKDITNKMIQIVMKNNPVYRPPDNLDPFYEQVDLMLTKDKQDTEVLLRAFTWACEDNVERNDFKGWRSVICTNKQKGKTSNPAQIFRFHFDKIHPQMQAQKNRKFAPSSNDAKSLEKMEKWMEGAL